MVALMRSVALFFRCYDVQQKAKPRGGEPFSSRHPESASPARDGRPVPGLGPSAPREFIRSPVSENGE